MPRILRILNRLNLGGPTYNAAYLSKYLAPEFETLIVCGERNADEESSEHVLRAMGLDFQVLPEMRRTINPFNDVRAFLRLVSIIRRFRPDIVHTHAAKAGTLGRLAAMACGVKVIVHTYHGHFFHSYFPPLITQAYISIERNLARMTNAIVVISPTQHRDIAATFHICPPEKARIIPLGFDLGRFLQDEEVKRAAFRRRWGVSDDDVAIAIVGRIAPIKNHALFLEAFAKARSMTRARMKAFVVGDGAGRPRLEEKARVLGLGSEDIAFTSWIKEVDELYAGVDVVALTSLNEGTPVSVIEAQAAGRVVVATDVGGVSDVVRDGETALLCPSGNAEAFAAALVRVAGDVGFRQRFGRAGRAAVLEKYSFQRLAEDTGRLYRELLASG